MKPLMTYALIFFSIISCSKNKDGNILYVEFEKVAHLTTESPVICNGIKVGKINSFAQLRNKNIVVELEIAKSIRVTDGSKFAIVKFDSFGKRAIELIVLNKGRDLTKTDTVKGIVIEKEPIQQLDSIEANIALDSVFKVKKQ